MAASFFNTIILLGIVQGLIVGSLLFYSKKNRYPNRILAALIFLISLASFNLYGNYKDWFGSPLTRLIFDIVPLVLPMGIGPLIYFYVRSYPDPGFRISKKQRLHFLPMLVDLVPSLTIISFMVGVLTKLLQNKPGPWGSFIDDYNVYADIPRWLSISIYTWLSSRHLAAVKLKNEAGQEMNFKWLNQLIKAFILFQGVWLLYLVPYVIPKYTDWMLNTFDWYPVYIPMVILIYWIGIKGYIVSQKSQPADKKNANSPCPPLSPAVIQQVTETLKKAMEDDKVYLDPALNLAAVSKNTGFPAKIISAVLNQHLQTSFNEYINGYRVKAFTEKITLPEMNHLTIAGLALECGFNSQATFQRTFKEITGQSPSAFRKSAMVSA